MYLVIHVSGREWVLDDLQGNRYGEFDSREAAVEAAARIADIKGSTTVVIRSELGTIERTMTLQPPRSADAKPKKESEQPTGAMSSDQRADQPDERGRSAIQHVWADQVRTGAPVVSVTGSWIGFVEQLAADGGFREQVTARYAVQWFDDLPPVALEKFRPPGGG